MSILDAPTIEGVAKLQGACEVVQDAVDNSSFNGLDIFLGYPRNINLGFQITF